MPKRFFDIIPPSQKKFQKETNLKEGAMRTRERKDFQNLEGNKTEKKRPQFSFRFLILLGFVFLIVFGFFINLFFSKTKIEIWPKTEEVVFRESIILSSNAQKIDLAGKIIPIRVFENEKAGKETFSCTGKGIKEKKAEGIIRVYNAFSTSPRVLIPSRFVSAEGKLFWSQRKIVIPGARYEKGKLVPGYTDVKVVAAEPGQDYNIGPSTFSLPALAGTSLYTKIYAKSFSPMKGGFKGEISQLKKEDLEKAESILIEKLKKENREVLKKRIGEGFILPEEAIFEEILEKKFSVQENEECESFVAEIKINSVGLAFKEKDIEIFAKNIVFSNIPKDKKILEKDLKVDYLSLEKREGSENFILNIRIRALIFSDIDLDVLKKSLLGRKISEVKFFLENQPEIERINLNVPLWKRKIPESLDKVDILLKF